MLHTICRIHSVFASTRNHSNVRDAPKNPFEWFVYTCNHRRSYGWRAGKKSTKYTIIKIRFEVLWRPCEREFPLCCCGIIRYRNSNIEASLEWSLDIQCLVCIVQSTDDRCVHFATHDSRVRNWVLNVEYAVHSVREMLSDVRTPENCVTWVRAIVSIAIL